MDVRDFMASPGIGLSHRRRQMCQARVAAYESQDVTAVDITRPECAVAPAFHGFMVAGS
jgi:hypothetical protein